MTVLEVIDLIRDLADRHPEIKGFYTGLESQHDDAVLQYPAVRVVFPYAITQDLETNSMKLSLTVTVMVNEARQPFPDPSVNVNYNTENSLISENDELYLENDMRDNAARLANHLIVFMQLSEKQLGTFSVLRADIRGAERAHADSVTGVNIFFEFYIGNPYVCEAEEIFNTVGGTACDRLLATLSDSAKINCILKSYNFASAAVQNALTTQQKYDIKYWALPQYDFADNAWFDRLTDTQEDDLSIQLLPFIDFSDPAIQALLTSTQKADLIAYLMQFIDFSDPAIQATISLSQQNDIRNWLCIPSVVNQFSILFDGNNEYVNVAHNSAINFERTDAFSVTAWVKLVNYGSASNQSVFTKRTAANTPGYSMYFLSGDLYVSLNNSAANAILVRTNGVVFTNAEWHHTGFHYDGSSLAAGVVIYVDGVAVSTTIVTNALTGTIQNTSALLIAGRFGFIAYLAGNIGYFRIWRIEFNSAQMVQDFNSGIMLDPPIEQADLAFGWRGATDGVFTAAWGFIDESGNSVNPAPTGFNLEFIDKVADVPV